MKENDINDEVTDVGEKMVKRERTIVRWSFPISLLINTRIFL